MFDYIKGILIEISTEKMILETSGIGYEIFIPISMISQGLHLGQEIKVYLKPIYREDSQKLFGFISKDERHLFNQLSSISGIGPKTALSIIGHMNVVDLSKTVLSSNAKLLSKIPGIGLKTAERIIVEMRDKVGVEPKLTLAPHAKIDMDPLLYDGISALTNLGYSSERALKAVEHVLKTNDPQRLDVLIKAALKII